MNNRIKELAEQAGLSHMPSNYPDMTDKQAEMWAAFEAYQPTADKDGHGDSWRVMCRERTEDAAWAAYCVAPEGSAARAAGLSAIAESRSKVAAQADRYAQRAIDAIKEVKP
jgi:hypothetical protein